MHKSANPFDELAAMFLSSPGDSGTMTATAPRQHQPPRNGVTAHQRTPIVELLLVGHLPVRGSLWLTPYADAIARQSGPACLLRFEGGQSNLQLLRTESDICIDSAACSLQDAVNELASEVDVWIIRPRDEFELQSLLKDASLRIDRLTLLTSIDEAAMVAAYQTIKQVVEMTATPPPPLHLATVGCAPDLARTAIERLNRTTLNFLSAEIHPGLCLSRMEANVRPTGTMNFSDSPGALADVIRAIQTGSASRPPKSGGAGILPAQGQNAHSTTPTIFHRESKPVAAPPPRSTHTFATEQPLPGAPRIKLAPKPSLSIEPKPPTVNGTVLSAPAAPAAPIGFASAGTLASHVEGLSPLPLRAPDHDHIELAIDAAGRIHLLGDETTLRQMPVVGNWVKKHRELLQLALPQFSIDAQRPPLCHIFSPTPIAVGDLHGSDLCLHVLAPVSINGQTAWYSAPLNVVTA